MTRNRGATFLHQGTSILKLLKLTYMVLLAALTINSHSSLASDIDEQDPFQGFNRASHKFNQVLDDYIARPAALVYAAVVPDPLERGISNMFDNLGEITNVANDLLQAKFGQAANDSGRFLINTTLGVGGLFDVAQSMGLAKSEGEDFSQTLAVWGVPDGPFLMLPLLGPSSLRDMPTKLVDRLTDPMGEIDEVAARNAAAVLSLVSSRAELLEFDDMISGDSYIFLRDIYLQRREFLENDGVIEDDFGDLDDY